LLPDGLGRLHGPVLEFLEIAGPRRDDLADAEDDVVPIRAIGLAGPRSDREARALARPPPEPPDLRQRLVDGERLRSLQPPVGSGQRVQVAPEREPPRREPSGAMGGRVRALEREPVPDLRARLLERARARRPAVLELDDVVSERRLDDGPD